MRPTFRRQQPSPREQAADPLQGFHRLSFSFQDSMRRLEEMSGAAAADPDLLPTASTFSACVKARKLLAAQGVNSFLADLSGRTVLQIDRFGEAPLNRLAASLHERHFGARLAFDPTGLVALECSGVYFDESNVVAIPYSLILEANTLQNRLDPTLGHELTHLATASMLRRGVLTPRGIEIRKYAAYLSVDDEQDSIDEGLCVRHDFQRARHTWEARHDAASERHLGCVLRQYERETWTALDRTLHAVSALSSGPTPILVHPHYGAGMVEANFLFLDGEGELLECRVPLRASPSAAALRAGLIEQLGGALDLTLFSYNHCSDASSVFEPLSSGEGLSPASERLALGMNELKRKLPRIEPEFFHAEPPSKECDRLFNWIAGHVDGPRGLQAALGAFLDVSGSDEHGRKDPALLASAARRVASNEKLGAEMRFLLANTLYEAGEHEPARSLLHTLYRNGRREPDVANLLAVLECHHGGDMRLGLRLAQRVLSENKDELAFWDTYGYALFKAGEPKRALKVFNQGRRRLDLEADGPLADEREFITHYVEVLSVLGKRAEALRWESTLDALTHRAAAVARRALAG